ncbi:hypothetical protein BGW36DRAFT_386339 [Talaromyces proteolyticus]|uniref:F-box domain-containing protein n=1 Tax=Talaromyces proteolyticus TaxID=1131652 RepID=A0AAD4KMA0_9EURO|nr:uncharacterized protein BGW36DRAFT_386339 [Talaromyces proteolyticus]KAH8691802.1 hypothetical protein BGW36DRAFT_386339 [Talaromyces proteolyticus]
MKPITCVACQSTSCRSVPDGPSSPVRCFFFSNEVACRADRAVGVKKHIHSSFNPSPVVEWHPWMWPSQPAGRVTSLSVLDLPNEIIFQIAEDLSEVDKFAIRFVCSRLYSLFTQIKPPYMLSDDMQKLLWETSLRDSFRRGCDLEVRRLLDRHRAMCSICKVSHSRYAFTNVQLSQPPVSRSCRYTTEILQLCSHKSMTILELLDHFRMKAKSLRQEPIYTMRNALSCSKISHQSHALNKAPQIGIKNGTVCIYWACAFQFDPRLASLKSTLMDFEAGFCPHLTLEDICRRILQKPRQKRFRTRGLSFRCRSVGCSSEITLEATGGSHMILSAFRYFDARSPERPGNLAQLTSAIPKCYELDVEDSAALQLGEL